MVLPGSHLRRINEAAIARYQNFVGQLAMACPAGSLLVCHHGIWHGGQPNLTDRARTMFKLRLGPRRPQLRTWDTSDLADPQSRASSNAMTAGTDTRSGSRLSTAFACGADLTGDARSTSTTG